MRPISLPRCPCKILVIRVKEELHVVDVGAETYLAPIGRNTVRYTAERGNIFISLRFFFLLARKCMNTTCTTQQPPEQIIHAFLKLRSGTQAPRGKKMPLPLSRNTA